MPKQDMYEVHYAHAFGFGTCTLTSDTDLTDPRCFAELGKLLESQLGHQGITVNASTKVKR